ncbi:MAG: DinB family protein [Pseudomonadota bacterium]
MTLPDPGQYRLLADYNQWANRRLMGASGGLTPEQLTEDRGAFFTSLLGTFNHMLVADRIWLWRLTGEGETYDRLDIGLFTDLDAFAAAREAEDTRIIAYACALTAEALTADYSYKNMAGAEQIRPLHYSVTHFFNHQTHHRGQIHGLLSGFGLSPPSLDLVVYYADAGL